MARLCIADEEILLRWGEFVPIQSLRGIFSARKDSVSGLIVGRTDKPIAHNNVTHVGL